MNSTENFEIKLKIKDRDGKIIAFNQRVDLEVNWVNWKEGRAKVPQEVIFKRDGQEYRIIIKELKVIKTWLKKWTRSLIWDVPPNASYQIYHGEPNSKLITSTSNDEDKEIEFTNRWNSRTILAGSIILVSIFVGIISLYFYRQPKKCPR